MPGPGEVMLWPPVVAGGGDADEARISINDSNLANLARRGAIRVSGEGGETVLTATTAERRGVRGFLSYCGSTRA